MFYIFKTVYVAVYSNISRYTIHQTVQLFIRSKNGIWKTHTTTTIILLCSLKPCRISLLPDPMVSLALLWFAEYSVTLVVLETVAFCRWGSLAVTQCNWLHSVVIKEQIVQFCIECRNCCSASAGLFLFSSKFLYDSFKFRHFWSHSIAEKSSPNSFDIFSQTVFFACVLPFKRVRYFFTTSSNFATWACCHTFFPISSTIVLLHTTACNNVLLKQCIRYLNNAFRTVYISSAPLLALIRKPVLTYLLLAVLRTSWNNTRDSWWQCEVR